jgi:hypothetical protein
LVYLNLIVDLAEEVEEKSRKRGLVAPKAMAARGEESKSQIPKSGQKKRAAKKPDASVLEQTLYQDKDEQMQSLSPPQNAPKKGRKTKKEDDTKSLDAFFAP